MLSSVGLEVMNSTNSELNWKTVTKGRRSRKSRSLNAVAKVGNSSSPKRVGDFSGSDSDKFGDVVLGQSTSGKTENVPIKKRRHLLESPIPHPWTPTLCRLDSASPGRGSSSPLCEDHQEIPHPSCSDQKSPKRQLQGIDGSATARFGEEFDGAGDFSGIELLAAAASMDDDEDNANKQDLVVEDSLMPKNFDTSSSATHSKLGLKSNESENSLRNVTVHAATASQSPCGSPEDATVPKVSRQHWDLNTLMDAWDEPHDDSIAENDLKDVNDDMHMEERQKGSRDPILIHPSGSIDESPNLNIEENEPTIISPGTSCSEPPILEEHIWEPPNSSYFSVAIETFDQVAEKDASERNSNQVSNADARIEIVNHVINTDVILDSSPFTKPFCSSGMSMSKENINTMCGIVTVHDEDCSSNVSECERTIASNGIQAWTQDVTAHDLPSIEISESAIIVQQEDAKYFQKASEVNGTSIQDCQPVLISDSDMQTDGTFSSDSTKADCQMPSGPAELIAKHEDNNLPNDGSNRVMVEDSCKSFSAGAQCDDPTSSVGRIGSAIDGRHDSDVSQDNDDHMVVGGDMARFQEEYDSPYEDGELRGSFLYSWEDNELEIECVDYESDGRNEDSSDAADYPGSEIVEGGYEPSQGTGRRNLPVKRFPEGKCDSGPIKHSLRRHFVKDDSDNNDIAGKGSNAGSGTTVEQSMEMVIEENYHGMERRQLADRRNTTDLKVTQIDEYASKTARGKLHSRIEGLSTDGKDFFIRQCRLHHLGGSYSRPERDISPDKYQSRYRPVTHGEKDGFHKLSSWGSRKRYTSSYQGAEGHSHIRPRNKTGDSADKIGGLDFHDPRQTANYMSKGLHRPLIRRAPVERGNYFDVGRRMQLTRGVSNYRSRGHYSQRSGRDYGEDFEPLPDDAGTSVCMSGYLSRREQSFSPNSGRSAHMNLSRRRSRSRSRTRSPRAWHSSRGRLLGIRRHSRSPDFRSEARMERTRVPFSKPIFTSEYGEGYISPSRGRFSPQRNCRWDDDRTFADNHMRRRRSPVREFRRTQRFDAVGPSGRLKRDEYFRPMVRPGRFSFITNGGRGCKSESNYDGRRRNDNGEMMHRGLHSDEGANIRRFRNNAADDFETSNLNNEDNVRVSDPRDVPQTQGDKEDKRAFKI